MQAEGLFAMQAFYRNFTGFGIFFIGKTQERKKKYGVPKGARISNHSI
jgi:hypothetical protein